MIRLACDADAPGVAGIYRPVVEGGAASFELTAPDELEMALRIRNTLPSHPWLVGEEGGQIVGYAYATMHRSRGAYAWSVETSVYVAADFRRRGVGTGLYRSLFAVLAAQGYVNAFAGIALPNPGSVALHESLGFEPIGVFRSVGFKKGRWHDVGWWQRAVATSPAPSALPCHLDTAAMRDHLPALVAIGQGALRTAG